GEKWEANGEISFPAVVVRRRRSYPQCPIQLFGSPSMLRRPSALRPGVASFSLARRIGGILRRKKVHYFTFAIFTMLPLACGSFGSFTTVTYNSLSPSLKARFVVPSPAVISNTCRSLPSGDIFKILPPNHW